MQRQPLSRFELGLILVVAAVPRLAGLGHASLWLDEILSSLRIARPFAEAWEAWKGNPVHPPLSEISQWLWFRVVEPEPLRRLLPIAFGVVTVVLLVRLADRWFGRRAAWATALVAAFSPVHVRYSQELRGYALGLLALVIALSAAELALKRGTSRGWAILGLALSLCYWSLYIAAIALVPILLTILQTAAERSTLRRDLTAFALALLLSAALFLPWFTVAEEAATKTHERQATEWTWPLAGSRWQFLTVGGVEGTALSAGALLFAALAIAGAVAAARSSSGRSILAAAVAGSVGVEVVLWLTDHWSNGRYNLASWPFLVLLAGLGSAHIADLAARLGRGRKTAWVAALLLAALLVFEAAGLADYYRRGRPDWQSVAEAVQAMAAPDRTILVSNEWTRISLGYYLARLEGAPRAAVSNRPRIVDANARRADLPSTGCTVLVDSSEPKPPTMGELLQATPAQIGFPRSGARVAVGEIPPGSDPWHCLPAGVEQAAGERPIPRWLDRRPSRTLEFTAGDQRLRYGWSYPESTPGGMTFRWALGRWAAIDLPSGPASTLRVAAWSLQAGQILSVYRGRRRLTSRPLATTRETLEVPLPADFGTAGGESLVFGFARHAGPEENPRPLAVAFDLIELLP